MNDKKHFYKKRLVPNFWERLWGFFYPTIKIISIPPKEFSSFIPAMVYDKEEQSGGTVD
jgi:hypothetical protein